MTSLKNTLNQSQRLWSAHTNPLTLLGGVVLTTPPIFELANQSAPFSQVIFALDQSQTVLKTVLNRRIPLLQYIRYTQYDRYTQYSS